MFTHNFLNQIEDTLFQPYFMNGIEELHAKRLEDDNFGIEARDYGKSRAVLASVLSSENNALLEDY